MLLKLLVSEDYGDPSLAACISHAHHHTAGTQDSLLKLVRGIVPGALCKPTFYCNKDLDKGC